MGLQGWRARPRAPGGSLGPSVRGISGASLNGSSDPQGSLPLTTTKQTHLSWHPNGFPSPSSPSIIQSLSQPPSLHHPHSLLPGHPQGSSHQSCIEFLTTILMFNKAMKLLLYLKNTTLHFRVRFRPSDLLAHLELHALPSDRLVSAEKPQHRAGCQLRESGPVCQVLI